MLHILKDIRFRSILLVALVVWAILAAVWYLTLGWDPTPAIRPLTRAGGTLRATPDKAGEPVGADVAAAMDSAANEGLEVEVSTAPPAGNRSPSPQASVTGRGGFVLQAGAFQHEGGARSRLQDLESRGHPVRLDSSSADGLIRILVGPFSDRSEARRVQRLLEADGIGAFVRSIE